MQNTLSQILAISAIVLLLPIKIFNEHSILNFVPFCSHGSGFRCTRKMLSYLTPPEEVRFRSDENELLVYHEHRMKDLGAKLGSDANSTTFNSHVYQLDSETAQRMLK